VAATGPFSRVLIANRGEIAVRVARACRLVGKASVAVFSEADFGARHVREADMAVCVGPAEAAQSYLNVDALLEAARKTGADAVHPGYGFLSENAAFARAVQDAGLVWIGPPADVIDSLESKTQAKAIATAAGVPTARAEVIADLDDPDGIVATAAAVGYPVLVKPEAGGGGKGMKRVDREEDLLDAVAAARRIARAAFSNETLFIERFVERARHVEVQVLADRFGVATHVGERECSLQRRHQKVIEEAPCADLSEAERAAVCESGRAFAAHVGYLGAGTVEFLFDPVRREHHFLEMNTRLQVEHPVTEMARGVDLVAAQLHIAAGGALADLPGFAATGQGAALAVAPPPARGHAVEVRVYAEDPARGYLPQTGTLLRVRWPDGPFVRVDTGFETGDAVSMHYDPMLAKVIAWGRTRTQALDRLAAALRTTVIHGLNTNIPFLLALLERDEVRANDVYTSWLDVTYGGKGPGAASPTDETTTSALTVLAPGGSHEALARSSASGGQGGAAAAAGSDGLTSEPFVALSGFSMFGEGGGR
jgi:acetyl-CoA/propionyl-CoA carboxylase biotin carboxyl carrier protein